jgi:hypothetical protein
MIHIETQQSCVDILFKLPTASFKRNEVRIAAVLSLVFQVLMEVLQRFNFMLMMN